MYVRGREREKEREKEREREIESVKQFEEKSRKVQIISDVTQ